MNVEQWAAEVDVGTRVVYLERGMLDDCRENKAPMQAALRASDAGLVFLAQRRTTRGFQYEATRISRPTAFMLKLVDRAGRPVHSESDQ